MKLKFINSAIAFIAVSAALLVPNPQTIAAELTGRVEGGGSPSTASTVTLYAAEVGSPKSVF